VFSVGNAGTKSECEYPYVIETDGTKTRLYVKDDNPFENQTVRSFEGKVVHVTGVIRNGVLEADSIEEAVRKPTKLYRLKRDVERPDGKPAVLAGRMAAYDYDVWKAVTFDSERECDEWLSKKGLRRTGELVDPPESSSMRGLFDEVVLESAQ